MGKKERTLILIFCIMFIIHIQNTRKFQKKIVET